MNPPSCAESAESAETPFRHLLPKVPPSIEAAPAAAEGMGKLVPKLIPSKTQDEADL